MRTGMETAILFLIAEVCGRNLKKLIKLIKLKNKQNFKAKLKSNLKLKDKIEKVKKKSKLKKWNLD